MLELVLYGITLLAQLHYEALDQGEPSLVVARPMTVIQYVTDLVIGELLLVVVKRQLIFLVLQVDSTITHSGELSGPRQEHHTEGHYAGGLKTETWRRKL